MDNQKFETVYKILKNTEPFKGQDKRRLSELIKSSRLETYQENQVIINEGSESTLMYIIIEGDVDILKMSDDKKQKFKVNSLSKGSYFGELSLFGDPVRSAEVKALTKTVLLSIDTDILRDKAEQDPIFYKISYVMGQEIARRLENTTENTARALKSDLEKAKLQLTMGKFILLIIFTMSFYAIALSLVKGLVEKMPNPTIVSAPLMLIFSVLIVVLMIISNKNISFFGINTKNFLKSMVESLIASVIFIGILTLLKYILVLTVPSMKGTPVFDFSRLLGNGGTGKINMKLLMLGIVYMISCPFQELGFRGVLQGAFEEFYKTSQNSALWSILIANGIFATIHAHLSPVFAVLVFIPGMMWGFLYARHKNVWGISLSHMLIGGWTLLVLNAASML